VNPSSILGITIENKNNKYFVYQRIIQILLKNVIHHVTVIITYPKIMNNRIQECYYVNYILNNPRIII